MSLVNEQTNQRRATILAALKEHADNGVSGETLAQQLHISRVAVGKHIAALRELGYGIDSVPGTGYLLQFVPDLPLPLEVTPLLQSCAGPLFGVASTGSTNEDVKELAHQGAPEGTVVLAAKQTAGKGRLGRKWESPEGGLYLSMLFRPQATPLELSSLGLVVGLGAARGLNTLGYEDVKLKWPNDVLLGEGKLCGILTEMAACGASVEYVVSGIGTNVHRGKSALATGAYLDDVQSTRLPCVAAAEIDGIMEAYQQWQEAGMSFAPFVEEYNGLLSLTGQQVCVRRIDGSVVAEGMAAGVDEEGRLLVDGVPVVAGEVTLRGV